MRTVASLVVLASLAAPVAADGRKVIVMPSDGRADAKVRQRVDAGVLKLARTLPDSVAPGEVSMSDLAAALGCNPDEAACKDEVLTTLTADEIIATTVVQKPQGFEVTLRRITKGGMTRETATLVSADKAESVEGLATVFVVRPVVGPPTTPPPTTTPPPVTPPPTTPPPTTPAITTDPYPPVGEPLAPVVTDPPPSTEPIITDKRPVVMPGPRDGRGSSKYYKVGMGVGGGMLLLGLLFWGSASDLGDQIAAAPVRNKADVAALKDLETRADDAARAGNVFVLGGLIVGGVSTYYYLKHKKARSSQARLMPTVMPGGAGLVFGGSL